MINFDDYLFRNNQKVKVGQSGLMDPYVVRRHIWYFLFRCFISVSGGGAGGA